MDDMMSKFSKLGTELGLETGLEDCLVIYTHGFRPPFTGTNTFGAFPSDVKRKLSEKFGIASYDLLFNYDTKEDFTKAVVKLETFILEKHKNRKVILVGHSMGGLLSVRTAYSLVSNKDSTVNIKGVVTFDAPLFGLNYSDIGTHITDVTKKAVDTHGIGSVLGGFAVAAVGSFIVSQIGGNSASSFQEYYTFLTPLTTKESLEEFSQEIQKLHQNNCLVAGFYALDKNMKTFTIVPKDEICAPHFCPVPTEAEDVIASHSALFGVDYHFNGYMDMVIATATEIKEAIANNKS